MRVFKNALRAEAIEKTGANRSWSTVEHTLRHCKSFFEWFRETESGAKIHKHLPGYFNLTKRERSLARIAQLKDVPTLEELHKLMAAFGDRSPAQRRDQAVLALLGCTGMRIDAAISLRGGDIDWQAHRIHQNSEHVRTKNSKNMSTYIISYDERLISYFERWMREREQLGFGDGDPLFPPNSYLSNQPVKGNSRDSVPCWKSPNHIQRMMREAHSLAGLECRKITPHCLRSMIVHELLKRAITAAQLVAVSKNLGHSNITVTLKHYANISDSEVQRILAEISHQPSTPKESDVVLIDRFHADALNPDHPEYSRVAKLAHKRNEELRRKYR